MSTKKRNSVAKDLKTPKYRPRVVKNKKPYDRKKFVNLMKFVPTGA